ncbi:MAG: 3-deoxy-D-manno-octulosonic acid transferase [Synergistaceae bacterium]|jgi:3-deoxy-D-manno-octulosonic-acid transferase|nr:3-deoxy-D-manno-octulosonic acid transferase [Synergistaceae bacterium]
MIVKLLLYRLLTSLVRPFVPLLLAVGRGKGYETKDRKRRQERYGIPGVERPDGVIFWFNASSVGEGNSILPLVDIVLARYPGAHALITTSTVTGAENIRSKTKQAQIKILHQFLPLDLRVYTERFFGYWRPSVGFFVDSDFWPNLILSARDRNIPLILLNGRLSDRSYARWMRNRDASSLLMSAFVRAFSASRADREKLSRMGISRVDFIGNIKYGAPPMQYGEEAMASLASRCGGRKTWVASVTHAGEDEIILRAHQAVRNVCADALLVLAPRHVQRSGDIYRLSLEHGFRTSSSERDKTISSDTEVFILDVFGDLGLYYAFSDIVFVGGSLLPTLHGHNPIEPARMSAAILAGPHTDSFADIYETMKQENAVITVKGWEDLGQAVSDLMSGEPEVLQGYRDRAFEIAEREAAVLERMQETLLPELEAIMKKDVFILREVNL